MSPRGHRLFPNLPWKNGAAPAPPGKRPKCIYCGKELKPQVFWDDYRRKEIRGGFTTEPTTQRFDGYGYLGNGFWCTNGHAYKWALREARKT